jgi:hypothetical protein
MTMMPNLSDRLEWSSSTSASMLTVAFLKPVPPAKPVVSFRINRKLSGWNLH